MSPCHFYRYSLVFPQTLENKPTQQTREQLPNYKRRHNIFSIHLVRTVYLAKKTYQRFTFLFFSSKSKQKFCLPFSLGLVWFSFLRVCFFKVCFTTGFLTNLICSRRAQQQYMRGGHQPQGSSRSSRLEAGGSPSTCVKDTAAPSCTQRLHFPVPSTLEYTKILNSFGLSLAKQYS